ncbi:unnamed protein product [Blepharisma stoltei]|uniref:Lipase n=1 Tax=Blepharisma stoltei TaxID=1481888 RepID=A0AAU9I7Y3_9CILI|nr:unnamed protein product [Blepharisma stoltei]
MVLLKALLSGIAATAAVGIASYYGLQYYISHAKLPPELTYTFEELCTSKGYKVQTHQITTNDGYILCLYRISAKDQDFVKGKTPVLMVHGLTHHASSYVISQKSKAPAFALADEGFDVWLLNTRGNHLSRKHETLDANQPEYWEWCANHIGANDIPKTIDYILEQTEKPKLNYIGHSQGCFVLFQCVCFRPDYGDKVNVAALMAPVAGFISVDTAYLRQLLNPPFLEVYEKKGINFLVNYSETPNYPARLAYAFPRYAAWKYQDKLDLYLNNEDPKDLAIYLQKFCGGTSIMNLKYWSQVLKERSPLPYSYDYGEEKNREVYGTSKPPQMQLSNLRCKVALLYGKYDTVITPEDGKVSISQMPQDKIIFQKFDYNQDHAGFAVSANQEHMADILKIFKENPIE